MPVSSYPRFTVQGTGAQNNTQNGTAVMVLNPSTNKYEAATAATFGGGGGAGGATAANQTTQINEAIQSNTYLTNIITQLQDTNIYLTNMLAELATSNAILTEIRNNQTNYSQITVIGNESGSFKADVNANNELLVRVGS
jgi:hypothetical protein